MSDFKTTKPPLVLVVEDDPLLRLGAIELLEDAGFETLEAGNAADALNVMKARADIGVLFTDVQMPGAIDGIELAQRIHFRWPHVLLLITSGNTFPSKCDIPDHGHFLRKPYRREAVVGEIYALAREAAARSAI